MHRLRWTERAVENLADIASYISETSPSRAERVIAELTSAIALLTTHAELGKAVVGRPLRELVIPPYRVFYRQVDESIQIVTIVHGRREQF
jgi:toxin ParE1/3/4